MQLDINMDAAVAHTARLERMPRSALPIAVRNTLNNVVFDIKQRTMPARADAEFINRRANFFKANSRVEMAKGFDIGSMNATVGFRPLGGTNRAVDDLEQQEHGGDIGGRSFIPLKTARSGNSWAKNVRRNLRISDIANRIVDAEDSKGDSRKERFIRAAIHAGRGGFVLGNYENGQGNRILYHVRSITRVKGNMVPKLVAIYAVQAGRKVRPKATHFMETATLQSAKKLESYYIENAEKQISKMK